MVPVSVLYQGQLRCVAVHDNSGVRFITDAPTDNLGRGESFSPTDLVATALGSCMVTTMAIIAQKEQLELLLDGTTIAVEKHMSTAGPRRIARLVVRLTFPPGIPVHRRLRLMEIAENCPVAKSLHPDIIIESSCSFPD